MIRFLKQSSPERRLLATFVSTLVLGLSLGIWVNLLTDKLNDGLGLVDAISELGWYNLLLAAVVASALPPLLEALRARKAYIEQTAPTLQTVLELTLRSVRLLHPLARPNGRYFEFDERRAQLVRKRDVELIADATPHDYLFNAVRLDEGLVICTSFAKERPLYKELTDEDRAGYSEEMRKRIPPHIRWVLACPVRKKGEDARDAIPIGAVCIWGSEPPARDRAEAERLESIVAAASDVFTEAIYGYRASSGG